MIDAKDRLLEPLVATMFSNRLAVMYYLIHNKNTDSNEFLTIVAE